MVCKYCGCENLEGTTLCVFCGKPMEKGEESISQIMTAYAQDALPEGEAIPEDSGDIQLVSALHRLRKTDVGSEAALSEGESRVALDEARVLLQGSASGLMAEAAAGDSLESEQLSEQAARIVEQAVEKIVSGEDNPEELPGKEGQADDSELQQPETDAAAVAPDAPLEDTEENTAAKRRTPVEVPPSPLHFEMEELPAEEEAEEAPKGAMFVKAAAKTAAAASTAGLAASVSAAAQGSSLEEAAEDAVSEIPVSVEEIPAISMTHTSKIEEENVPHIPLTDTEKAEAAVAGLGLVSQLTKEDLQNGIPAIPLDLPLDSMGGSAGAAAAAAAGAAVTAEDGNGNNGGPDGPKNDGSEKKRKWLPWLLLLLLAGGGVTAGTLLLGNRNQPGGSSAASDSRPSAVVSSSTATQDPAGTVSSAVTDPAADSSEKMTDSAAATTDKTGRSEAATSKDPAESTEALTTVPPSEVPATAATTTVPPTTPAPTTVPPTTPAPTTVPPTTPAPTTVPPTTPAPTTVPPTTPAPTTVPPTTPAPTTVPPTTPASTTQARERNPFYNLAQAKAGDVIRFGSYDQDGKAGAEPIEWIVLSRSGNRVLVISRYCFMTGVYSTAYNPKIEPPTPAVWSSSRARSFLNGSFLSQAFTAQEQANILMTTIKTPANPSTKQGGGPDTNDRVFLLSIQEVQQYMSAAQVKTTATATAKNAYVENGEVFWWLRSAGNSVAKAAHTRSGGAIDFEGEYADVNGALRPAMWLNGDQAEYLP